MEWKAGTVYYQIIHQRSVRQLKTEYRVFEDEWDEAGGTLAAGGGGSDRSGALLKIREQIDLDLKCLNTVIRKLDRQNRRYTADDIVTAFTAQSREQSFFSFMRRSIGKLRTLNKYRTAENYYTAMKSLERFMDNEDLLFDELDSDLMMRYEAFLNSSGVSRNTVSFYMRIIRAVYNRAVEQELTEQNHPFRHVYTGVDKTVKRAISFTAIKRIKALDLSRDPALDFARDMFLFSFYTRGMSFIDMAYLRKTDLRSGVLIYRRRKTGQQLTIKWETCMQAIVAKYESGTGCRRVRNESPYMLPILGTPSGSVMNRYRCIMQQINRSLKKIAELAGLDVPLTMYVARHSWASVARSKNIPVSVISEGMGHDSEATTQIYLASLDTSVIDRANSLILKGL